MNKLVYLTVLLFISCGGPSTQQSKTESEEREQNETTSALQLNNGIKWKADSTTHENVAALTQLVNDSSYRDSKNVASLSSRLQTRLDTLVQQCKMTGPAHEALHSWLKPVLHDTKELKEGKYDQNYAQLKKDVQSFYDFFD
ncbi:MAG: hypothetical protein ACXVBH_10855 [Flavisolibacter sp.]